MRARSLLPPRTRCSTPKKPKTCAIYSLIRVQRTLRKPLPFCRHRRLVVRVNVLLRSGCGDRWSQLNNTPDAKTTPCTPKLRYSASIVLRLPSHTRTQ